MAILSAFKVTPSPMKTEISRMTLERETRLTTQITATISAINKDISLKNCSSKKFLTRVTLKRNSFSDEIRIKVKQNNQFQEGVLRIKEIMESKLREYCHAEELVIIDAIQRLGLECYFQDEIHYALRKHYEIFDTKEGGHDLHDTALGFRLLRQQGYNVPAATFSKFTDMDGKFKPELGKDIQGLMNLFEASHLRVPGDNILDHAGEFCQDLLSNFENVEPFEICIIQNTLSHPYHKSLPKFMALDFLQNFELSMKLLHDCKGENKWMAEVSYLARIDINKDQMTIKHEINEFCRWWEELRLPKELKHARNQPVKWHMWSLACLPGPNMAEIRLELTKTIAFIYIIDDIFDVYGTLEELTLFTETITRWEYASSNRLPEYMRICLEALFDTTNEISQKVYGKHGLDPRKHIQKVWKEYINACLLQAKWVASGYMPTTEEYMKNEIVSTGSYIVHTHIFLLLGEGLKDLKSTTDLLSTHPDISSLAATILRLWDDLGSSKDEGQKHDGSVIACYINEHDGSTPENAQEYVFGMLSDAWSRLNETLVTSSPFSADYKAAIANFARIIPMMYNYDENHQLPGLEKLVKPLLNANE